MIAPRTADMAGDPFGLLLSNRIVFLGGEVNDFSADAIISQLLLLDSQVQCFCLSRCVASQYPETIPSFGKVIRYLWICSEHYVRGQLAWPVALHPPVFLYTATSIWGFSTLPDFIMMGQGLQISYITLLSSFTYP